MKEALAAAHRMLDDVIRLMTQENSYEGSATATFDSGDKLTVTVTLEPKP